MSQLRQTVASINSWLELKPADNVSLFYDHPYYPYHDDYPKFFIFLTSNWPLNMVGEEPDVSLWSVWRRQTRTTVENGLKIRPISVAF